MQIFENISDIKAYTAEAKKNGKTVGFVPTMGFFHDGHLELMRWARRQCEVVVISIFVNPLQFCPGEDYKDYPRDMDKDLKLAEEVGVDAVFAPTVDEMYPEGFCTYVEVEGLSEKLCGKSRPGHFKGVTTVVLKLFNVVQPHKAYLGLKDAQQTLIIDRMTRDLNLDIEIVMVPTIREEDGTALSSRNIYLLNEEERKAAALLYKSLKAVQEKFESGERSVENLKSTALDIISAEPLAEIDYVELLTFPDLKVKETVNCTMLLALAVRIGKARLIDSVLLEVN